MKRPRICAVITENDFNLAAGVVRFVDYYEVRIDLIGAGWQEWVCHLQRPWIATNRLVEEGGKWAGDEAGRVAKIIEAVELGARIVDLELRTPELSRLVAEIKKRRAECLISVHNLQATPETAELQATVKQQLAAGADICKIATTAIRFEDNLKVLRLFPAFPDTKLVATAMGEVGVVSRVLSAMVGGYFTYASIVTGKESAAGQLTVTYLRSLYQAVRKSHD